MSGKADEGTGNNAGGGGENTGQSNNQANSGQGGGGTGGSVTDDKTSKKVEMTEEELQAEKDRIAAKVRDEEKRKYEKAQADAAEAAKKKADEEAGNWKNLYDTEKQSHEDLKSKHSALESTVKTLSERINRSIDEQTKEWPASVKKLDPGTENVEARLRYLEQSSDLAKELLANAAPPNPEMGRGTRVTSGGTGVGDPTDNYLKQTQYAYPGRKT